MFDPPNSPLGVIKATQVPPLQQTSLTRKR